ncbi:MAG: putative nucleotidyltransferase substrate binding domain-containing protein, partial [Bacteroidales bacterium]
FYYELGEFLEAEAQRQNRSVNNLVHREFSEKVCSSLDHVGYNFCTGKVMAMNPQWCQPLAVWKNYYTHWINNGKAQDLLNVSIFFDFRLVYGDQRICEELKAHVNELSRKNPAFVHLMAQNTLSQKPQVGFWGNILLETAGAPPETVNIKNAIMPIVSFARVNALKYGLAERNTLERLKMLHQKDVINVSTYNNVSQAFVHLARIRLQHQTELLQKQAKPDNLINTKQLNELDKIILKKVLSYINNMLSLLAS